MENPAIVRYNSCNCSGTSVVTVQKRYNGDPRYLLVNYYGEEMVFLKTDARLVNKGACQSADECCTFPVKGVVPPTVYPHLLLIGKMYYAEQAASCFLPATEMKVLELPADTVVSGAAAADINSLYASLQAILQDCNCSCSDEEMTVPMASIVTDLNPNSPTYGQPINFIELPDGCTPACYYVTVSINNSVAFTGGGFSSPAAAFNSYTIFIGSQTFADGDLISISLYGICTDTCTNTGILPPDALLLDQTCFYVVEVVNNTPVGSITVDKSDVPTAFVEDPGSCTNTVFYYTVSVSEANVIIAEHTGGCFTDAGLAFADYQAFLNTLGVISGAEITVSLYGECTDTCTDAGGVLPGTVTLLDIVKYISPVAPIELRIDISLLTWGIAGNYNFDMHTADQTGFNGTETFNMFLFVNLPTGTLPGGGGFVADVTNPVWALIGNMQGFSNGLTVGKPSLYGAQRINYPTGPYFIYWFIDQETNVNHSYSVDGGATWQLLNGNITQHLLDTI